jgi:type IV pilus assembly protein PilB
MIQAQRLVRRICTNCKEEVEVKPEVLVSIGFSEEEANTLKVHHGKGCKVCNGTGYKGRIGLYEVMEMDDELRELVVIGATAMDLRRKAIENGMITLRQSGLCKIREGITTIEEVVRETVL